MAESVVSDGKWEKLGNSDTFKFMYLALTTSPDYKFAPCYLFLSTWACT